MLRDYLTQILTESGEKILQGVVDIAPYRDSETIACTYCAIKPVCKFDALLEDNKFRVLPTISREDLQHFGTGEGDDSEY
jgi:ATP-dependent helicase/nuclease subunit B